MRLAAAAINAASRAGRLKSGGKVGCMALIRDEHFWPPDSGMKSGPDFNLE
jgi:hypothetical protein